MSHDFRLQNFLEKQRDNYVQELVQGHQELTKRYSALAKTEHILEGRKLGEMARKQKKKLQWRRAMMERAVQRYEAHLADVEQRLKECNDLIASNRTDQETRIENAWQYPPQYVSNWAFLQDDSYQYTVNCHSFEALTHVQCSLGLGGMETVWYDQEQLPCEPNVEVSLFTEPTELSVMSINKPIMQCLAASSIGQQTVLRRRGRSNTAPNLVNNVVENLPPD